MAAINPAYVQTGDDDNVKEDLQKKQWVDLAQEKNEKYVEKDQKEEEALAHDDNPHCGWFGWRPKFLQFFNGPKGYLFFVCIFVLTQGITVNGYVFISITTLERRFNLPSVKSGWIASTYDFTVMCVIIFVTYFGEKGHKPKFLAAGVFIFSLGSVTFALPHFLTGLYDFEGTEFDICDSRRNATSNCSGGEEDLSKYYVFFIAAQILHGLGSAPLYTLGVTYIDENVSPHQTSIFIGIFQAVSILGPAVGFIVGGMLLDIYTDFTHVDSESLPIDSNSPLWVGAWWLGFLISSGVGILLIIPLSGFARRLPGALAAQRERKQEARAGAEFETRAGFGVNSLVDLPRATLNLLKNPTYMLIDLGVVCEGFIIAFLSVFGAKYLESMFNISAGNAALVAGLIVTPAGVIGNLLSGYIVKRFDLTVTDMLRYTICMLTASMFVMSTFIMSCDNIDLAGVTVKYDNTSLDYTEKDFNLTASCNANCKCDNTFDPVCGSNDVMYYSSCYAGCAFENKTADGVKVFQQCACIYEDSFTLPQVGGTAASGRCSNPCKIFAPFLILLFFVLLLGFSISVPSITTTLRCIDYDQRSLGLGLQSLLGRALGSVPGPVAYGAAIDMTCLVWEYGCNKSQTCWMYSNRLLSFYTLAFAAGLRIGAIIFYSGALLTYKPAKEDETKDKTVIKDEENTRL